LVLKDTDSEYRCLKSRTSDWRKFKFFDDTEARVLKRLPPVAGKSGISVRLLDGTSVTVSFANSGLISGVTESGEVDKLRPGTVVHIQAMAGKEFKRDAIIRAVIAPNAGETTDEQWARMQTEAGDNS
jgi:hypothetical protein